MGEPLTRRGDVRARQGLRLERLDDADDGRRRRRAPRLRRAGRAVRAERRRRWRPETCRRGESADEPRSAEVRRDGARSAADRGRAQDATGDEARTP